ncbi:hypothetical protein AAD018_012360 [Aestuariibius insulae]
MRAETVLITRSKYDPVMTVVDPANVGLLEAIADQQTLGASLSSHPGADLTSVLGLLLGQGTIIDLHRKANP